MKKLLTLFLLFSAFAYAQTPLNLVSTTDGGSAYEVCFHDNYLFVGSANTFMVYDLMGPDNTPETLHYKERLISNIDQILVHNGYLYLCANHAGLFKYDISDPENPEVLAEYIPTDLEESIYDISFYGDSLLVAAKNKLLVLEDAGTSLNYLSTFAYYPGQSRIRGLDIKDSLMAYTVAYPWLGSDVGVHLVDLNTMTELDFFLDNNNAPLEVYFGENTELLHVMGGGLGPVPLNGRYYALDYSTPTDLSMVYADTIEGFIGVGSISTPMSMVNINDTIYISTQGGGPNGWTLPDPYTGQIHIYDATDPGDVHYLNDVYAGLYHFDADINPENRKCYIASEWYGILTIDVTDVHNEIDHGKTLTGGWCHGSAQKGNRLIEANEGYGVRLFDVTDRSNPTLIDEDTAVGFCRAIAMDDSANYAYAFYLTKKRFRVYDANTLALVADTSVDSSTAIIPNFQNARYHNGRVAVVEELGGVNRNIVVMDVSDPMNPYMEHLVAKKKLEHLMWLSDGNLLACAKDSLIVFDPEDMSILDVMEPFGSQDFMAITQSDDTLFVFGSGATDSIAMYAYDSLSNSLSFISSTPYEMDSEKRILMTTDDTLLYITSTIDSLKALEIYPPHNEVAAYNHGADFIFDNLWGVQDLYYNDGYLFLNEYMGQTTILNTLPLDDSGFDTFEKSTSSLTVYPNPSNGNFQLNIPAKGKLDIYSLNGKHFGSKDVTKGIFYSNNLSMESGIYILRLTSDSKVYSGRVVIHK